MSDATGFAEDGEGETADGTANDADAENARQDTSGEDELLNSDAKLKRIADANPELRGALRDAAAYKEVFETPAAARQARDVWRM